MREKDGYENIWHGECAVCEKAFTAKRYDAECCSSTCRGKLRRATQKRQADIDKCCKILQQVIKNMPAIGDSIEFIALSRLEKTINLALQDVESE